MKKKTYLPEGRLTINQLVTYVKNFDSKENFEVFLEELKLKIKEYCSEAYENFISFWDQLKGSIRMASFELQKSILNGVIHNSVDNIIYSKKIIEA